LKKIGGKKVIFKNFFVESKKKFALDKEILCREPPSWLSAKKSVLSVFFLCREFFGWLSAKKPLWRSLPGVFCLTLDKEPNSRQSL
jgi:hypothetical protein